MLTFQCSSASRKFLNQHQPAVGDRRAIRFSALQRAENSSIRFVKRFASFSECFSALQRAENSSIDAVIKTARGQRNVSVLFSEPKIPQYGADILAFAKRTCFSALQRAENSSIQAHHPALPRQPRFQCSSASRKFLNLLPYPTLNEVRPVSVLFSEPKIPQFCQGRSVRNLVESFSALQRAENSSIRRRRARARHAAAVSVLFSEPKIPQSRVCSVRR